MTDVVGALGSIVAPGNASLSLMDSRRRSSQLIPKPRFELSSEAKLVYIGFVSEPREEFASLVLAPADTSRREPGVEEEVSQGMRGVCDQEPLPPMEGSRLPLFSLRGSPAVVVEACENLVASCLGTGSCAESSEGTKSQTSSDGICEAGPHSMKRGSPSICAAVGLPATSFLNKRLENDCRSPEKLLPQSPQSGSVSVT
mmetsp:Transcript_17697/g.31502  ORF Transcript_17697/g.31502 Transcript_17697/m.31502 type:complete len:200 (+) Transcript_17697:112-711(+)